MDGCGLQRVDSRRGFPGPCGGRGVVGFEVDRRCLLAAVDRGDTASLPDSDADFLTFQSAESDASKHEY